MATYDVGYDANGNALDFTTHALAISGATAGDTLRTWYANNARLRMWGEQINVTKGLSFIGQDLGLTRRWPMMAAPLGYRQTVFLDTTLTADFSFSRYILLPGRQLNLDSHLIHCIGIRSSNYGIYLSDLILIGGVKSISINNTYPLKECVINNVIVFGSANGINIGTSDGSAILAGVLNHCMVISSILAYIRSGTNSTMNTFNCIGITPPSGTCWSGGIGGSHNACTNAANVPSTGRILLDWNTNHPRFWCDEISDFDAWLGYNITTASCLYHAGTNRGISTDILGRTRHTSTPSIGAFEGQDIPSHPSADDVRASVAFILNDGSTRIGELYTGDEIHAPNISVSVVGNTATFRIADGESNATNKIFLRDVNATAWPIIPAATKTGNGEVVVSNLPSGAWWARVESWVGSVYVAGRGDPVFFVTAADKKEYSRSRLGQEIDTESTELLRAFGEPVTYLRGTAAVNIIGIRSEYVTAKEQSDANISGATQWEIRADDLDFGTGPFTPKAGDQIIDARGDVWVVLPEPKADEEFIFWRVPTKRMEWA